MCIVVSVSGEVAAFASRVILLTCTITSRELGSIEVTSLCLSIGRVLICLSDERQEFLAAGIK